MVRRRRRGNLFSCITVRKRSLGGGGEPTVLPPPLFLPFAPGQWSVRSPPPPPPTHPRNQIPWKRKERKRGEGRGRRWKELIDERSVEGKEKGRRCRPRSRSRENWREKKKRESSLVRLVVGTGRGPFVVSKGRRVLVAVRNYRPRRK